MIKCKYADEYKAERKPTCGCETCNKKWNEQVDADIELLMSAMFK